MTRRRGVLARRARRRFACYVGFYPLWRLILTEVRCSAEEKESNPTLFLPPSTDIPSKEVRADDLVGSVQRRWRLTIRRPGDLVAPPRIGLQPLN